MVLFSREIADVGEYLVDTQWYGLYTLRFTDNNRFFKEQDKMAFNEGKYFVENKIVTLTDKYGITEKYTFHKAENELHYLYYLENDKGEVFKSCKNRTLVQKWSTSEYP